MPLIGDLPFWQQTFCLAAVCFLLFILGAALAGPTVDSYEGTPVWAIPGYLFFGTGLLLGPVFAVMFLASSVAAVWPENVPDPPVPASRIQIDPEWDSQRIEVRCPDSENIGEIELLGYQTPSLFRVEAARMRTGSAEGDLSVDAGFMIYERQMWRSQTPAIAISGFRADGRWQSGYVDTTLILTRGEGFLMNAGLGTAAFERDGEVRHVEQECRSLMVAF